MILENKHQKRIILILIVLVAFSILTTAFVFATPQPAFASEETPDPGTDYIPLGCVCIVLPLLYDCCDDAYLDNWGRLQCNGFWYYSYWLPYGCDPWNPR